MLPDWLTHTVALNQNGILWGSFATWINVDWTHRITSPITDDLTVLFIGILWFITLTEITAFLLLAVGVVYNIPQAQTTVSLLTKIKHETVHQGHSHAVSIGHDTYTLNNCSFQFPLPSKSQSFCYKYGVEIAVVTHSSLECTQLLLCPG